MKFQGWHFRNSFQMEEELGGACPCLPDGEASASEAAELSCRALGQGFRGGLALLLFTGLGSCLTLEDEPRASSIFQVTSASSSCFLGLSEPWSPVLRALSQVSLPDLSQAGTFFRGLLLCCSGTLVSGLGLSLAWSWRALLLALRLNFLCVFSFSLWP